MKRVFEKDFETLNSAQQQAVTEINKSLLVLAPAGTGKTKVIAMRTAYLTMKQVAPEHILCLTFTNKAAKEMKERIALYLPKAVNDITIKTFHAFCYHLISHEKAASHFAFPCTLIDETDSKEIVEKIIKQNGIDDEDLYYPSLLSFFENIKKHSLSLPQEVRDQYKVVIEDYFKDEKERPNLGNGGTAAFIRKYGLKLLNTYTRYLRENNCIDFMDLIVEAKYLLEQPDILKKWQAKYKVIQVDEMQDTSKREYEIIKCITAGNQLSMFGDFNQTIYEWRGSNPVGMTSDFKADFNPMEITLAINYRSTQVLLNAANDYIRTSRLYPIQCQPHAVKAGEKIHVLEGTTQADEIQKIIASIKAHEQDGHSLAVLTRTNYYAKDIAAAFQKAGLKCTVIEDTKFFRKKEIKEVLAFFDYSINDRNGNALLKLCQHPYLNMPDWLIKEIKATKSCYLFLHDWFRMGCEDPYAPLYEAYKHQNIVVLDVEATGLCTTKDDIIQIAAIRYGKDGVKAELDVKLKPTKTVGESVHVHGFTDEYLKEVGIAPREALKQLLDFVEGAILVGHNINYDLQIIGSMLARYGLPALEGHLIYDTLDLAYKVYPKLPNHKLDTLSQLVGTKAKPNHNALYDILATSEVLTHLLEIIMTKQSERLQALEAYYGYVLEYKEKLLKVKEYINSHTILESITYLMNDCHFKGIYDGQQVKAIRELYRIADAINEEAIKENKQSKMQGRQEVTNETSIKNEQISRTDQIINLLTFSALHYSEIEQTSLFKGRIPIITVHQSKGLEFDDVYIAGCNDRIFPSYRSVKENKLTEELRLFYVAMTRARKRLFVSYHQEAKRSILVDEINKTYCQ